MFSIKAALVALVASGLADASPPSYGGSSQCMSASEAQQVATNFGLLLSNYSDKLANEALAANYEDYTESVASLIDSCPEPGAATVPLSSAPLFVGRAAFEKAQSGQPSINYQQLNIWPACTSVAFRWQATNTGKTNPKPVVGVVSAEVKKAPAGHKYPWIITKTFSEFDSDAWVKNLQADGLCPSS